MDPRERDALITRLADMADELRAAARRLGEEGARTPAAGGGFSLVEQAWHLADLEREGFGARIGRLLMEDDPYLPDFDGARIAAERDYRRRGLQEGISAFAAARAANIERLRTLPADAWERAGRQEGVGRVSLDDLPRMMLEHDTSHRAEIATLQAAGVVERLVAAWNGGDGDAFARLFAEEAVYHAADGATHRGRVAIARLVKGAGAHVAVEGPVDVREDAGGALVSFAWAMAGAKRAGRITCRLSQHAGTWRIERLDNEARPPQNT